MTWLLNPQVWVALIAAVLIGHVNGCYQTEKDWKERWKLREDAIAAERAAWSSRMARLSEENTTTLNNLRREANEQLQVTADALSDTLLQLRLEKSRAARKPAASAPPACRDYEATPAQLSGPDAEFLARIAAEADQVVIERNACIRAYTEIAERFNRAADEFDRRLQTEGVTDDRSTADL